MVYPRQPNRKLNLNIKSSNTKIILIFKNLPVACVENQKSEMSSAHALPTHLLIV